jgi:hypothetical protein
MAARAAVDDQSKSREGGSTPSQNSFRVKRTRRSRPVSQPNVRLTITFSEPAVQWLEQEASNRAISLADLLRRIADETRGSYIIEPKLYEKENAETAHHDR